MIITKQKKFEDILNNLKGINNVFLVGCGECSTTCKSGGEPEVLEFKQKLEEAHKTVTGYVVPKAPCIAPQVKTAFAQNRTALKNSQAIVVLSCGLGVQSVKANDRQELLVLPGCDTLFGALMDATGAFKEVCSACAECVLDLTGGICPVTLCPKGLLNGPCGGVNKGKCEVDKERDCAWVIIYKELEKCGKIENIRAIHAPKDFSKTVRPHKLVLER